MSTAPPPAPSNETFETGELDWIEKAALENLKGRVATADTLAKEAVTTLTVLLAGAGGAWAYALKLLDERATAGAIASLIAAVWLTGLAMALVLLCMRIEAIPPVYNQPRELLGRSAEGATFDAWRRAELDNIEKRIGRAVKRNDKVAVRLNWIRALATLTPILSGVSAWVFLLT